MRFCLYSIAVTVLLVPLGYPAGLSRTVRPGAFLKAKVVPITKIDPRSGQIVQTILVAPRPGPLVVTPSRATVPAGTPSAEVQNLVESAAKNYAVSPDLIHSVIQVESNYDAWAVSPKGAQGLMQLMPATAARFGVKDTFDPKQNIEGGVRYLKFLQQTFKDDRLAIAAYNAGEGAVARYGTVPPYPETVDYVAKVGGKIARSQQREAVKTQSKQQDNVATAPEYRRLAQMVGADGRVYLTTQ